MEIRLPHGGVLCAISLFFGKETLLGVLWSGVSTAQLYYEILGEIYNFADHNLLNRFQLERALVERTVKSRRAVISENLRKQSPTDKLVDSRYAVVEGCIQ